VHQADPARSPRPHGQPCRQQRALVDEPLWTSHLRVALPGDSQRSQIVAFGRGYDEALVDRLVGDYL
jgi:hypothetical protein